jgi:hypothetical protein
LVGAIFPPWTTLAYLIVFPGGVVGQDWLWFGLGLLAAGRKSVKAAGGTSLARKDSRQPPLTKQRA